MESLRRFLELPFKYHLLKGTLLRLALIIYADYHDQYNLVPYTDVDYKVFTDAARHVVAGNSPYKRHTYRYSPLLAFLMIPNVIITKHFGKILFSFFDILVSIAIKALVDQDLKTEKRNNLVSTLCTLCWLYSPFSIGISTRGNADSVPCFFIILAIFFLQTEKFKGLSKYLLSGIFLGVSIHLRLYPLAFSFPMYLSLGNYKINRSTKLLDGILSLMPNKKQVVLTLSCVACLALLTYFMYALYGYEFLFETYIYHLFRKDTRHNFSILFYYSYLTMDEMIFDTVKCISTQFQFVLLFIISLAYGCNPKTLPAALFYQAMVLVTFNSVVTSQYFIWYLSLLPLVVHNYKMTLMKANFLNVLWIGAQCAWLIDAFSLEFKCLEVFLNLWFKSVVFFCTNVYILGQFIKSWEPNYGFGKLKSID